MAQRRRTRRPPQTSDEAEATPQQTPQTPQSSDAFRAATAWGDVVRRSLERSERGEEAERELSRRRNNSGQ
jgi:hypothetical protein